ncbi:hypothetical protein [Nitrospira sp. Kam-Ns4a]
MHKRHSFVAVWLPVALLACAPIPDHYLNREAGRATQESVRVELGPPDYVRDLGDGRTVWIYAIKWSTATYLTYANPDAQVCNEYSLTFDATKVLREWTKKGSC